MATSSRKRERIPLWTPGCSQLVMFCTGLLAWTVAIGLAVTVEAYPVSTIFALSGLLLTAGGSLYPRIEWFGTKGLGVAPISRLFKSYAEEAPPPLPEVSPDRDREYFVKAFGQALEEFAEAGGGPRLESSGRDVVDAAVRSYAQSVNSEATAVRYFENEGYEVDVGGPVSSYDFLARRDGLTRGVVLLPELGLTRDALDWGALPRQFDSDEIAPVVVTDAKPSAALRARMASDGIGLVQVNPDVGEVVEAAVDPKAAPG